MRNEYKQNLENTPVSFTHLSITIDFRPWCMYSQQHD